jgi:hypothetical protein
MHVVREPCKRSFVLMLQYRDTCEPYIVKCALGYIKGHGLSHSKPSVFDTTHRILGEPSSSQGFLLSSERMLSQA